MSGLEGQKLRGYSTGENVYGYKSVPVGELKMHKGKPKYEGMIHKINEEEADIIRRIYKEFITGKSVHKIVIGLNEDKITTKKGKLGGWNTSTVSRILKNKNMLVNGIGENGKQFEIQFLAKRKLTFLSTLIL